MKILDRMDGLDPSTPWYVAAVLAFTTAVMPFLTRAYDNKKCEARCNDLEQQLKKEVEDNKETRENYLQLKGAFIVIRKKLMEIGIEDIPGIE